jgi:hypothetical protein
MRVLFDLGDDVQDWQVLVAVVSGMTGRIQMKYQATVPDLRAAGHAVDTLRRILEQPSAEQELFKGRWRTRGSTS